MRLSWRALAATTASSEGVPAVGGDTARRSYGVGRLVAWAADWEGGSGAGAGAGARMGTGGGSGGGFDMVDGFLYSEPHVKKHHTVVSCRQEPC